MPTVNNAYNVGKTANSPLMLTIMPTSSFAYPRNLPRIALVTQFPLHCGHAKMCLTFAMPYTIYLTIGKTSNMSLIMINLMEPGHDPKSQVMQRQWDTLSISGNVVNVPDATMQELIMSNVVAFILRFKITAIIIKYLMNRPYHVAEFPIQPINIEMRYESSSNRCNKPLDELLGRVGTAP
eukprot:sb/3471646/